ncbi:MAG: helix-turn-helix domain-containing protein [Ardenticatenaceae bacterium]|nr:helix-turn-helix domain-containing protein [Ardenticatenaceae bacterium]
MRWNDIKHEPCSIARTLSIIGDRWTLLILRNAFLGMRRFDDFQRQLDVTRHLLTDRLNLLHDHGILHKVPYQERPTRHEYRLTAKGKELYPIIMTLVQWGDKWMAGDDGPPLNYVDRQTGEPLRPILVDQNSGRPIDIHQVKIEPGPGLDKALEDPEFRRRWMALLPS